MTANLRLLGGFELAREDGTPVDIGVRKAKALLIYLALNAGRELSRDRLAAILWEQSNQQRARHSLRQALADLRRVLPEEMAAALHGEGETLRFDAQACEIDVTRFERLLQEGLEEGAETKLREAVKLYAGDLAEGFNPRSASFEDWLLERQSALRERALDAMRRLLDTDGGDGGIRLGLRILALDPLREDVHRRLMSLYAAHGRHGAALKQYRICRASLQRELGVATEPATDALYREILAQRQRNDETVTAVDISALGGAGEETRAGQVISPEAGIELRFASVLAVNLPVSAADDTTAADAEQLHQRLTDFTQTATDRIERYGGRVARQLGETLVGVFGTPGTQGNECERAARAADAIRERLSVCQGIANGAVTVSDTGTAQQIVGACLQQALRLAQQAPPGEVLISDTVMHSARGMLAAQALANSTDLRLTAILPATRPGHQGFVGRERELALLGGMLSLCNDTGAGQNFLIRGDAGIGKSSLMAEFMARARDAGYAECVAHVPSFGAARAELAPAHLLRALLDSDQYYAPRSRPGAEQDEKLALITSLADDTENGLNAAQQATACELLGLEAPAALRRLVAAMDEATRMAARRDLYTRLLARRARRQAMLLLVEDIHWADGETLDILAALAARVAELPVIMLMTTRFDGEALNPAWRGGMHGAPLTTLDLGPLREDEALRIAGRRVQDEALARRYVARAEGNPLFLEQLLESGQSGTLDGARIPDSIQALIWSRLERLADGEKHCLQCAAVLGASFSGEALRALQDTGPWALDGLLGQRLLRREGQAYAFTHALIRECVYNSLLDSRRKALHRRAAEWYAQRDATLHAGHLDRAGDTRAARACADAAVQLARDYHYPAALALATRGLDIARDDAEKLRLGVLRARLLLDSGNNQAALAAYAQIPRPDLPLSSQSGEAKPADTDMAELAVDALLGHAAALAALDQHRRALRELDAARAVVDEYANDARRSRYHYQRGNSLFPLGEIDACLRAHNDSLDYARQAGSARHQALALSGLGDAWYQRGYMLSAHDKFHACIELSREHGYGAIEISNLPMRALTRLYKLDLDAGLADVEQAIELNTRVGNQRGVALARNVQCMLLCQRGAWQSALAAAEPALASSRELGANLFSADNLSLLALIAHAMHDKHQARAHIEQAWRITRESGLHYCGPIVLGIMALIFQDDKRAWALSEGERLLNDKCVSHNHLHFYDYAMNVALEDHDWASVNRYADSLQSHTAGEPLPWSDFHIARGRVLAVVGAGAKDVDTVTELKRVIEQARAQQARPALAELESALAEIGIH